QRGDEAGGLEQVGFPLPVRADEKLLPPGKLERGKAHVAKMPQGEFAQAHGGTGLFYRRKRRKGRVNPCRRTMSSPPAFPPLPPVKPKPMSFEASLAETTRT